MPEKNHFEDAPKMTIPVGNRADEFERILIMDKETKLIHIKNYIEVDGDPGNDKMFFVKFDGSKIYLKCIFFQKFIKPEIKDGEYDYDAEDETSLIYAFDGENEELDENYIKSDDYEKEHCSDWEECEQIRADHIDRLRNWTLLEDVEDDRSDKGIAKIKAFLFYHLLGKDKVKPLMKDIISDLIKKKALDENDLDELNEIMETGTINHEDNRDTKYMFNKMKEMASDIEGEEGDKLNKEFDDILNKL